jgi:hypothetical protein
MTITTTLGQRAAAEAGVWGRLCAATAGLG